jgi:hypothetical protein
LAFQLFVRKTGFVPCVFRCVDWIKSLPYVLVTQSVESECVGEASRASVFTYSITARQHFTQKQQNIERNGAGQTEGNLQKTVTTIICQQLPNLRGRSFQVARFLPKLYECHQELRIVMTG